MLWKNKISYIENLVLSGGEPTLEPKVIEKIISCIIKNNISVNMVRIVSNGQIFSQSIIDSLNILNEYMI